MEAWREPPLEKMCKRSSDVLLLWELGEEQAVRMTERAGSRRRSRALRPGWMKSRAPERMRRMVERGKRDW